jgi:beta-glucanase (GH16 family)
MFTKLVTAFLFSVSVQAWVLQTTSAGSNFINAFDYFTESDPTHGFVQYVDGATAVSNRLVYTQGDQVVIKADNATVSPNGRPSVRIVSKNSYNQGLFLLDLEHMPVGCGTWPAFWMVGDNWPNNGEIDVRTKKKE